MKCSSQKQVRRPTCKLWRRVAELQKRYGEAGYQYDAVMAIYAHDFGRTYERGEPGACRKSCGTANMNREAQDRHPARVLSLHEGKYAAQITTFRGDMVRTVV